MKNIQFKKLIITFFAHIFVGYLYGTVMGLLLHDNGINYLWLDICILIFSVGLVTFVAYKEEVKRHYPFSKAVGVNFLGLVLFFVVAFLKMPLLFPLTFVLVLFAIKYKCKACIDYKRFKIE